MGLSFCRRDIFQENLFSRLRAFQKFLTVYFCKISVFEYIKILSWFKAKDMNISVLEILNNFFSLWKILKILPELILVDLEYFVKQKEVKNSSLVPNFSSHVNTAKRIIGHRSIAWVINDILYIRISIQWLTVNAASLTLYFTKKTNVPFSYASHLSLIYINIVLIFE